MKTRTLIAILIASTAALAAALSGAFLLRPNSVDVSLPSPSPYRGSIPPPGIRAPDFTLRDYLGRHVTMSGLRGSVVLLSFVDSKCKESCPIVAGVMARAMQQLRPRNRHRVVALLMSVNPTLDTPTNIHRFLAKRRHAGVDLTAPNLTHDTLLALDRR